MPHTDAETITDIMTPEQLDQSFNKIISDIQSDEFGKLMVYAASDALVLLRKRIIDSGIDAEGQAYKPYSTKPMLSGCKNMLKGSCDKQIGSKEKRKKKKWVTIGGDAGFKSYLDVSGGGRGPGLKSVRLFEIPGGYKEFRDINNRQSGFVDFSFSGRMWENIKVVSDNSEHNSGVARIGATTELDKAKLTGNTKRRTDILKLSKGEIDYLSGRFNMGITQIFHNNGL